MSKIDQLIFYYDAPKKLSLWDRIRGIKADPPKRYVKSWVWNALAFILAALIYIQINFHPFTFSVKTEAPKTQTKVTQQVKTNSKFTRKEEILITNLLKNRPTKNTIISDPDVVALIIKIGTPYKGYYLLDEIVYEIYDRDKLQVILVGDRINK